MNYRGILFGWLGLSILYVAFSARGASAASGISGDLLKMMNRALDPTVAAIPNRSASVFKRSPQTRLPSESGTGPIVPHPNSPSTPSGTGGGITPRPM